MIEWVSRETLLWQAMLQGLQGFCANQSVTECANPRVRQQIVDAAWSLAQAAIAEGKRRGHLDVSAGPGSPWRSEPPTGA